MSATPEDATGGSFVAKMTPARTTRQLALAFAVVLVGAYLSVLWDVTGVAGGRGLLVPVVFVAVVAGVASASLLTVRTALWIGAGSFLVGGSAYLVAIPEPVLSGATFGRVVQDAQVLATGNIQVVQIIAADVWAVAMAPAPVYLTLFLAIRHRYDLASLAGGSALGFVTLTGDAGTAVTLIGATSVLAMLGFGALESVDLDWKQIQDLGIVLAAGVVIARTVRIVPASGFSDGPSPAGGGTNPTLESGLFSTGNRASILGSINLSPEPRFTVRADRPALWHAGAYDRYTGDNWVRSGRTRDYRSALLPNPPGRSRTVVQRFTVQSAVATVPGAWRPVDFVRAPSVDMSVTSEGGLAPDGAHEEGDSYAVVSETPVWDPGTLRSAGTDYPGDITDRYLQVPEGLPERVARKANDVGGGADTPYDAAAAISNWLKANKDYSLDVSVPAGDVVDSFLFEMSQGYCVYFATTMVVMLRTLDVPARYAVGYTPGQQLDENRWLIRGLHSHAWVEVFFPGVGWVPFDPTPGSPRTEAEQQRISEADSSGNDIETRTPTATPSPTPTEPGGTETTTPVGGNETNGSDDPGLSGDEVDQLQQGGQSSNSSTATPTPDQQIVAGNEATPPPEAGGVATGDGTNRSNRDRLGLLATVAGLALGAYRFKLVERGVEEYRLRWQTPSEDPQADVERAFDRLEILLKRRYRGRSDEETPRSYLRAVAQGDLDRRARRVAELYERAHYGGFVTEAEAEEAIELVDDLVSDWGPTP